MRKPILRSARAAPLLVAALAAANVPAAPADGAAPSPGAIALLANKPLGPDEIALCRAALRGPRADSRATAARVARVQGSAGLVPTLLETLAGETDAAAAREEVLALGWLAGAAAHDVLLAAARRFDGEIDDALVLGLALRGPEALSLAGRLAEQRVEPRSWDAFFLWATRGGLEALPEAGSAAAAIGSPQAWSALFAASAHGGQPLADASVATAARAGSSAIRTEAYLHVLGLVDRGGVVGAETHAALAQAPEADAARASDAPAVLAFELLRRALGHAAVDRTTLLRALDRGALFRLGQDHAALRRLRGPEREALGEVRFGDKKWVEDELKHGHDPVEAGNRLRGNRIRTVSDLPPGVIDDLVAITGCPLPKEPAWAGGEARFDARATLERVGFYPTQGPAACEPAARALLLMNMLPTDRPPLAGQVDMLVLPLSRDFAACVGRAEPTAPRHTTSDADAPAAIREPRKTRSVPPSYPSAARRDGRQGVVIVEAVIGSEGCVRSAEVISSPHIDLAGEAIRSVVQWRYTPTLLDGRPVPVVMTVTVNFRLR